LIRDVQIPLNLKDPTVQKAQELFSLLEDKECLKGKSCNAKVAAVIFVASRQTNVPKNIKNILNATAANKKDLNSCYKKIKEVIPEAKVQT